MGVAALLFAQKMTTPVKSNANNNNANNSRNHATHTRTRRVRRDINKLPAQQGIATLTNNSSSNGNDNTGANTSINATNKNLQHSSNSRLHRRRNSNSINNTTITNKTTLTSHRQSQ